MTTLILHHLEPCWEASLQGFGTSFEELELKAVRWIKKNKPRRVILTRFEDYTLDDSYMYLHNYVDKVYDYGYGWEPDMFSDESEYCPGGTHSTVVHVPQWIKDLTGKYVSVGGAFRGECLEDIEIALRHVKKRVRFIESLCVG